jgi:hypothetical protein
MAHAAEVVDGIVTRVLVVPDDQEHRIQDFLANDLGLGGTWVQTSYNATIRKNYAGIGMVYDSIRDAFIAPKPFASWVLNEDTCQWEAPVAYPTDGLVYAWNEKLTDWEAIVND